MNLEALVGTLGGRNDRGIADQWVMNTRVGHQIGLELVQIHIQSAVETQGRGNGADDLGDEAVQVLVVGAGNI